MERVREMKRNSDIVTQSAQRDFDVQSRGNAETRQITPKVTNMPPNFPKETVYPSFKTVFEEENKNTIVREQSEEKQIKQQANNPIEKLFAEPDRALLLGLIMLLKSEKADKTLIMALTYILS
jgi:predicted type IV restriction endonuclease